MPTVPGSLYDLIRPRQQRRRDREAEGLGGLEVDHELELRGQLDGQVRGLGTLQDPVDVPGGAAVQVRDARSVRHQPPNLHMLFQDEHGCDVVLQPDLGETRSGCNYRGLPEYEKRTDPVFADLRECLFEPTGLLTAYRLKFHSELRRCPLNRPDRRRGRRIRWIPKHCDHFDARDRLMKQFQLLDTKLREQG